MQELNVRELSLATEDSQYGVRLQGEPDNERLGKRLKGDFKKVRSWLSLLANAMVEITTLLLCSSAPSLCILSVVFSTGILSRTNYRMAGNFCKDFNLANWQIFYWIA